MGHLWGSAAVRATRRRRSDQATFFRRIFAIAVCDNDAAAAISRRVAPSACIWRIASSRRAVTSRAFLAQEATC